MGKANRERRRAKEKERKRRQQTGPGPGGDAWSSSRWAAQPSPEETVAQWLAVALDAQLHEDDAAFQQQVKALAEGRDVRQVVDRSLIGMLQQHVTFAWRHGWQPADVVRLVGRRLGARHVRLVTDAIAAEMRAYAAVTVDERWQDQLAALDATVWWERDEDYLRAGDDRVAMVTCALQVLFILGTLPRVERLCPLPGTARRIARSPGRAVDERLLARVRALLAKAESTEFEAEAETFTAAAQSMMARHSIDAAMLAAESGGRSGADEPQGRRLAIDAPYEAPKAVLLDVVATANHCRSVWSRHLGFVTVLGFPSDLDGVEVLFTSLLVQATTAMMHAGARRDGAGRSRTRSFRQSFLAAYAQRIGERLREAAGEAVQQAVTETGKDLLPVLAARDQAVDEKLEKVFPELSMVGAGSISNHEGWHSGRAAADQAVLDARAKLSEASR